MKEIERHTASGFAYLVLMILILPLSVWGMIYFGQLDQPFGVVLFTLVTVLDCLCLKGLFGVSPNQGAVLQLFGHYVGTERSPGLRWANPLYSKKFVSLRTRNFETSQLKVNDLDGNPIEFAAVVSLRANMTEVAAHLRDEIQERLAVAGVQVKEARISHLAYAPEIAAAMLQRQQASAIVAARTRIVDGAVGMVEMALERLDSKGTVHLDEERKAAMVSNLLVVLCGERAAQPVLNTGTMYH